MHCFVQLRDQIFVKGYGFLPFTGNVGKSIGKNMSKNLSRKYSQKRLDHVKQFATDVPKATSKRVIQKTVEATCGLIGTKITNRAITNEHDKEIPKERNISLAERQIKIDDLRLI